VDIDDLIHLLDRSTSLQHIGLGCTFDPPSSNLLPPESQELLKRDFHFPNLRSLQFGNSEDGMFRKFNSHLLEAASWNIPSLTAVVIDLDARTSIEEVLGFLQVHGRKLKSLSLTDSGRVEGIPIGWNEIFGMCSQLTDMRLSYSPFVNFNVETFALSDPAPRVGEESTNSDLSVALGGGAVAQGEVPSLPNLITSPSAVHLQRLCFDKWEFFPGMECAVRAHASEGGGGGAGGPHMLLPSADDFLARVTAAHADGGESILEPEYEQGQEPGVVGRSNQEEEMEDLAAQEHSGRLLDAYCRVLDNIFEALGGKMTPALRVVQFDFHAGRLDLPPSCHEWWNEWIIKWRARGLRVEGCQHVPL